MDIKEIVFRKSPVFMSTEEQLFIIREYIKDKKNKDVGKIQYPNGSLAPSFSMTCINRGVHPFKAMALTDMNLCDFLFSVAANYFITKYNEEKDL